MGRGGGSCFANEDQLLLTKTPLIATNCEEEGSDPAGMVKGERGSENRENQNINLKIKIA